jgi:hypothetical protein
MKTFMDLHPSLKKVKMTSSDIDLIFVNPDCVRGHKVRFAILTLIFLNQHLMTTRIFDLISRPTLSSHSRRTLGRHTALVIQPLRGI